jgi:phosphonate transport system substrate-binding protein
VKKFAFVCHLLFGCFLLFFPAQTFSKQVVPFGLCSKYNPRMMYQFYQPFVDYLSEETPYRFEIKLSRTYQETIDRFGSGEIVMGSCGPVPYLRAREKYPVKPILRALSKDGKPHYRGMIIVKQDSLIQGLEDLKGRSFAFGQSWSTAGHIIPLFSLRRANVSLKELKRFTFLRHHDSVVHAVLKGEFDAGAVKDVVAYRYGQEGLRFIHVSDPIPTVPIVVRTNAPAEMIESVKTALFKLDPRNPDHQKKMAEWDEEFKYGFTEAVDSDYDSIREILRAIEKDTEIRKGI